MEGLGKRIIAVLLTMMLLVTTVIAADASKKQIGTYVTNGSTRASNIVGFDTNAICEHPELLFRFSVTTLADNHELAEKFYEGPDANVVKYDYGTEDWHKAISDYIKTHTVTGMGDGYWLGDHDTVDYRGHIIHTIGGDKDNPYAERLRKALTDAVNKSTQDFNKDNPSEVLCSFNKYNHLRLSYDVSRLFYDYVKYQFEHPAKGLSRDPFTYSMFKTLQQNVDDNDTDDPIVLCIEVQAPVIGDGEQSVTDCDGNTVYDPKYSYWATAADMVVRCGGSLEDMRNSKIELTNNVPTDTIVYGDALKNHPATSGTDKFTAGLTGSYSYYKQSDYASVKPCRIYGNVWPYRWTEIFYKDSYTEYGVRFNKKGLRIGNLIKNGKINRDDVSVFEESTPVSNSDFNTFDSYTVATIFADYNGASIKRDNNIYATLDRSVYPASIDQGSNKLKSDGIDVSLYAASKMDLISNIQDDISSGLDHYTFNAGSEFETQIKPTDLLEKLLYYKTIKMPYTLDGENSGVNVRLRRDGNLRVYGDDGIHGYHLTLMSVDAKRSGISYIESAAMPTTAIIGHLNYSQKKDSNGTPSNEGEVVTNFNNYTGATSSDIIASLKDNPLSLPELLNYNEPLTTDKDLTLLTGAQLYKVRLKFAYHVDNYERKIYLHNIQHLNPAYLTLKLFDASGKSQIKDNQIVQTYAPADPDDTVYTKKDTAEAVVRKELAEVNSAYSGMITKVGTDPYTIVSNYDSLNGTNLNIYAEKPDQKNIKTSGLRDSSTADLGGSTILASGKIGALRPSEGFSGYTLNVYAVQYHGDVLKIENEDGSTAYRVDHPIISITEGFSKDTSAANLMTDYVARTRHKMTGDSSFCTTMRYNNVAYIEVLDAKIEGLNSIDGYGVLDNLAMTDTLAGAGSEAKTYTQSTADKTLVLNKAMNEFKFKYYVAAYNTEAYSNKYITSSNARSVGGTNGYFLTKNTGHSDAIGTDTRETNIDNALLLNWDKNIHESIIDKGSRYENVIDADKGLTQSNYIEDKKTFEALRNMMYTTNLQRNGRLINSFIYPTSNVGDMKYYSDMDSTANFTGMFDEAFSAIVPEQCYVEDKTDNLHIYWDPTKFGGTDYGTLPIASALMTSIYFYRQCNYIYVMDDSIELDYDGKTFSLCGAEPFDSSQINAIIDNGVVSQLLLDRYYTISAFEVLNNFTTGTTFNTSVWHGINSTTNLNVITPMDGSFNKVATIKKGAGSKPSWIGNAQKLDCQRYIYWIRRISGHTPRYCRYNSETGNKLDLMNDTTSRMGSENIPYNQVRGYKALLTNKYIAEPEITTKNPTMKLYGTPYIGYNAINHSLNQMPVMSTSSPVFTLHGQYPYNVLKESLVEGSDTVVQYRKTLLNQLGSKSNINFTISNQISKTDTNASPLTKTGDTTVNDIRSNLNNPNLKNASVYLNVTIENESTATTDLQYISPNNNIVSTGGFSNALTVGSMNILRSNMNGGMNTGCILASYKLLLNDTRKYKYYIGNISEAKAEVQFTPKLLNTERQIKAADPTMSIFSNESEYSSRDVGRTTASANLDSRVQSDIELPNIQIKEEIELSVSTNKLSKYIGTEGTDDELGKTYAIRDQRVSADMHSKSGTTYDDKLLSTGKNGSKSREDLKVAKVYTKTVTSTSSTGSDQLPSQDDFDIDADSNRHYEQMKDSGEVTVSMNSELRFISSSGLGVSFEALKGDVYTYNKYGIQRKHDTSKDINILDIVEKTGDYVTDYENGLVSTTASSVTITPSGKDTDGIRLKLGDIYDTKNHKPRVPRLTEAKYVSVVPNFSFVNTEKGSNFIGYHAVQLDNMEQTQQFSFQLNNKTDWKPELKDFMVIAADESNRVIGTISNQNNFIWSNLQKVTVHNVLHVDKNKFYHRDDSPSLYMQGTYNTSKNYDPYPTVAHTGSAMGQLDTGKQFSYQKDMSQYDDVSNVVKDGVIPKDDGRYYNIYRLEFAYKNYLGGTSTTTLYIEQGLYEPESAIMRNFANAYINYSREKYGDSTLLSLPSLNPRNAPMGYLYNSTDINKSFYSSVVFNDLPVPYIIGTDLDNDIQSPEYDDTTGKEENIADYYKKNKISGIPMRAGDFFQIHMAIENYIVSTDGFKPIGFSFLEDNDEGYLVDNTEGAWGDRYKLDKRNAVVELVYDSSKMKGTNGFDRVAVFRMLRNANIQPVITVPNSAQIIMSTSTPVFTTYDTTILATNDNIVSHMYEVVDPLLSSPMTYKQTGPASNAYNAYLNGLMIANDYQNYKCTTNYPIYNEAIADFFFVTNAESSLLNTQAKPYMMITPYSEVTHYSFDKTKRHKISTQEAMVSNKTMHGSIIHSAKDSIWTSPNARCITQATNPNNPHYQYGDDKYNTEYLLRNLLMKKIDIITTRGVNHKVNYMMHNVEFYNDTLKPPIVFKVNNKWYVSPNEDYYNKNITCSGSGLESIKKYPDLLYLYADNTATPPAYTIEYLGKPLEYPSSGHENADGTLYYIDFSFNGKARYAFKVRKGDSSLKDIYDISKENWNDNLADKYNRDMVSSSSHFAYTSIDPQTILPRETDADLFSLDDAFTVTVDFKSRENIQKIKYAYIKFPFQVYARAQLGNDPVQADTDKPLIKYKANQPIPLGIYHSEGKERGTTDYTFTPGSTLIDIDTLTLDGMCGETYKPDSTTSARDKATDLYYLTDELCHFEPFQYNDTVSNYKFTYNFWIPLAAGEASDVRYEVHAVPLNIVANNISMFGTKTMYIPGSHSRNTLGYSNVVDIVGRIGCFTLNDIADFRWSDTFKKETDKDNDWYAYGLIHKVTTDPKMIVTEPYDIRGNKLELNDKGEIKIDTPGSVSLNTYSNQPHRGDSGVTMLPTPLQTSYNIHPGLKRSFPLNGYAQYYSFETMGNYYGQSNQPIDIVDNMKTGVNSINPNNEFGQEKVQVVPVYYDIAIDDRGRYRIYPLDVYQYTRTGSYKLINRNLYYAQQHSEKYNKIIDLIDQNSYYIYETNNVSNLEHKNDIFDYNYVSAYLSDNLKRKNILPLEAYTTKWATTQFNNFLNEVALNLQVIFNSNLSPNDRKTTIKGTDLWGLIAGSARLYQMESIIDNFGSATGNTSLLLGERYIQGTAQASFLRGRTRSLIGGPSNALGTEELEDIYNEKKNLEVQTVMNAQKYYYTHQVPSDVKYVYSDYVYKNTDKPEDVFLKNEETLVYKDNAGKEQKVNIKHYILTRFNIVAAGSIWTLRYNVPTNGKDTLFILDRAKTDVERADKGFNEAKLPIYVDIDNPQNYFNHGAIRFFSGDKDRAKLYDPPAAGFGSIPSSASEEATVATNLYKDPSGTTISTSDISTTDKPSTTETVTTALDPATHTTSHTDGQGTKTDADIINDDTTGPKSYDPKDDSDTASNGKAKVYDPSTSTVHDKLPTNGDNPGEDPPGAPGLPVNNNLDDIATIGTH